MKKKQGEINMKSLKKLMVLAGFIFLYGSNCLAHQVECQTEDSQNKVSSEEAVTQKYDYDKETSAIMDIVENETFVMKEVYFDGFQDRIRNCVFESPLAVWTIRYCEDPENELLEGVWYSLLAGIFVNKNTGMKMDYYLELDGRKHIHAELDRYGQYAVDNLALKRMTFIEEGSQCSAGEVDSCGYMEEWSEKRLPFLQTLSRRQEHYINQSVAGL